MLPMMRRDGHHLAKASVENLYSASPYAEEEDFVPPPAPLIDYMGGKPDDITVIVGRLV